LGHGRATDPVTGDGGSREWCVGLVASRCFAGVLVGVFEKAVRGGR